MKRFKLKPFSLPEKKAYLILILCLGIALLIVPIPFVRLQDDEAIYYVITKELVDNLKIPAHRGSTIVPFLLWAPALLIKDDILSMRLITALAALLTAIFIYFIALKLFDPLSALTSSLLYLFLFHVLRFGTRAMLDPFGAFFGILSLCFLVYGRPTLSGISFSLAAYSYQFWIPMFPLYLIQTYKQGISLKRFLSASLLTALILQALILAQHGFKIIGSFTEVGGPSYVLSTPTWLNFSSLMGIAQGWLEFSVFAFLPILGLAFSFRLNPAKWLFAFAALQFLFISLYPGFAFYGGASHYPYGLCPLLALAGGYGLPIAWHILIKRNGKAYLIILLFILLIQLVLFNHLSTVLSLRAKGVYDLGYEYDIKAINALNEMDKGGLILGQTTHGLLVDKDRFKWGESLELNPQLFMAYKVDVTFKRSPPENLQIVEVGPYIIISVPEGERLSDYINFSPSQMWVLRGSSIKATPLLLAAAIILPLILALAFIFGLKIKTFSLKNNLLNYYDLKKVFQLSRKNIHPLYA
jgi:hypothetical protein